MKDYSFVKSAFLYKNHLLMKFIVFQFYVFGLFPKKKADGIALGFTNVQEPTEFKIGRNPHKNRTPLPLRI